MSTFDRDLAHVGTREAVLDCAATGARGLHALLLPVLSLVLARHGATVVHGAGILAASRGGALLVLGGSGQGKSTLVTAAVAAGRGLLGDDLIAVRLDPQGLTAAGVAVPVALPADLAGHEVVGPAIPGDPRSRRDAAAPLELLSGSWPLSGVVVVGHSQLPGGELQRAEPREVFALAAAAGGLPSWRLGHAVDAGRRVGAAVDRLAEVDRGLDEEARG